MLRTFLWVRYVTVPDFDSALSRLTFYFSRDGGYPLSRDTRALFLLVPFR